MGLEVKICGTWELNVSGDGNWSYFIDYTEEAYNIHPRKQ